MTAQYGQAVLECVTGDIAAQPGFDAVVNAANAQLAPGAGVAGAIHRAAGPELFEEARRFAPIEPGQAVLTAAYRLPNRYVIHCLGPVYGIDKPEDRLLADCYRNALLLAERHGVTSIAFPAISTGIFGYPMEEAAPVAWGAILDTLPATPSIRRVRMVLYDPQSCHTYEQALHDALEARKKGGS